MNKIFTYRKYILSGVLLGLLSACDSEKERDIVAPVSTLKVNPSEEVVFPQAGGEIGIDLSTNRGWSITKEEAFWFQIKSDPVGESGEHKVMLDAKVNTAAEVRTSKVVITAGSERKELVVSQFGSNAAILLPQKNMNVGFNGLETSFVVNSNVDVTSVKPSDSWLNAVKVNVLASNTGVSKMYTLTVGVNSGNGRTGKIIFASDKGAADTLVVVQDAWSAKVDVPAVTRVGGLQKEVLLKVNASGDWTLALEGGVQPDWVTEIAPQSGSIGETTIKITLRENLTGVERPMSAEITCGTIKTPFTLLQRPSTARERDSLTLVNIFKNSTYTGLETWDYTKPMSTWFGGRFIQVSDRVTELSLVDWQLSGELSQIGMLDGLRKLHFSRCSLTKIPEEMGQLSRLQELSFASMSEVPAFPGSLKNLTALTTLDVIGMFTSSGTLITTFEFPDVVAEMTALEKIDFSFTTVSRIPASIGKLKNLTYLNCAYTKMTGIIEELGQLAKLEYLSFDNCPDLAGSIPATLFTGSPNLKAFMARGGKLSGEIPKEMYSAPSLYEVSLYGNNLEGDIPEELATVSKIMLFSVAMNKLGNGGLLAPAILADYRFHNSRAWYGVVAICPQQEGYGWSNCISGLD